MNSSKIKPNRVKRSLRPKKSLPSGAKHERVARLLRDCGVDTVCRTARCPNMWECFSRGRAAFLILGTACTRRCGFCAAENQGLKQPDPDEPQRVARAVREMNLDYAVVTSTTRDDLADGGASCFADTIRILRQRVPDAGVEVLIPDFQGDWFALEKVLEAKPDVLAHNVETVERLYSEARPAADYGRSLELLKRAGELGGNIVVKSSLMLGLGEEPLEIEAALRDVFEAGCHMLTLGQYLQPAKGRLAVKRYVSEKEFLFWKQKALAIGFSKVASGPFVRSSYNAREMVTIQSTSSLVVQPLPYSDAIMARAERPNLKHSE